MSQELYNFLKSIMVEKNYTWTDILSQTRSERSDSIEEILTMMVEIYCELGEHLNCLTCLSYYCEVSSKQPTALWKLIQRYYGEHLNSQRIIYEKNKTLLEKYRWCSYQQWTDFGDLPVVVFYQDEGQFMYIERETGILHLEEKHQINVQSGEYDNLFLLYNINNITCVNKLEADLQYSKSLIITWVKQAMYVYYSTEEKFLLAVQTELLPENLLAERLLFFVGWQAIEQSKIVLQIYQVEHILTSTEYLKEKTYFFQQVTQYHHSQELYYKNLARENNTWYAKHKGQIIKNICGLKPKILFISTRLTTVQHNRDCVLAAQDLGCETHVLEEQGNFTKISAAEIIEAIHDFKPDIIFRMYYFPEPLTMPINLPYVTWVQDPLPHILDKNSPKKLTKNNFLLTHSPKKEKMIELGYHPQRLFEAPVPANHKIYQPYILTEAEQNEYQTDICLVCNNTCFEEHILSFKKYCKINNFLLSSFEESFEILEKIMRDYLQQVKDETIVIDTETVAEEYLSTAFGKFRTNIAVRDKIAWKKIVRNFCYFTTAHAFRDALAHWLIEGKYNFKLYGHDWHKNPEFAPYAMGVAENGVTLAKIYQSSKIVLGTNPLSTGSARVYEAYLSGAFYLSNYVRPEADHVDIRDRFKENEEIPFFYDKQDLYDKLDYYLAQPEKRYEIVRKAREKSLQVGTYEALMKKMIQWLADEVGR